ncbi:YhfC family glutamic-type intramembrane protease [uncultured Dubosiella sp.]|uniref:YhfC family glutamic-type intramembrane protease n=1 Tax=uncultured Dubosiella sp. TaxID=1937011 RepID=UPI0026262561|nr:YhfC family glutamic-type intramembrane protease [uncultured Dubosiella sp.]
MLLFSQIFALLCSVFVPAGAAIWIALHYEGKWKIMLLGALTYIIFNIALFLPIVSMVTSFDPVSAWISTHRAAWLLLIALLTVVLAELFRYLVISLFIKYDTASLDAVSFGLGYGGFQTAMSVGVNVLISIILSSYIAKEGGNSCPDGRRGRTTVPDRHADRMDLSHHAGNQHKKDPVFLCMCRARICGIRLIFSRAESMALEYLGPPVDHVHFRPSGRHVHLAGI